MCVKVAHKQETYSCGVILNKKLKPLSCSEEEKKKKSIVFQFSLFLFQYGRSEFIYLMNDLKTLDSYMCEQDRLEKLATTDEYELELNFKLSNLRKE